MACGSPDLTGIVLIAGELATNLQSKLQSLEMPPVTVASLSERPHYLMMVDEKWQCCFESPPTIIINLLPTNFTGAYYGSLFEQSEHDAANWALLTCYPGIVLNRLDSEMGLAPEKTAVITRDEFIIDHTQLARVRNGWANPAQVTDLLEMEAEQIVDLLVRAVTRCAS